MCGKWVETVALQRRGLPSSATGIRVGASGRTNMDISGRSSAIRLRVGAGEYAF